MKRGDVVLLSTPWDEGMSVNRFRVEGTSAIAIRGRWETGVLEGKEAAIAREIFGPMHLETIAPAMAS